MPHYSHTYKMADEHMNDDSGERVAAFFDKLVYAVHLHHDRQTRSGTVPVEGQMYPEPEWQPVDAAVVPDVISPASIAPDVEASDHSSTQPSAVPVLPGSVAAPEAAQIEVFGRISFFGEAEEVRALASPDRRAVFAFDHAAASLLLTQPVWEFLRSLGQRDSYVHHKIVVDKRCPYLILFTPHRARMPDARPTACDAASSSAPTTGQVLADAGVSVAASTKRCARAADRIPVVRADWQGVRTFLAVTHPEVAAEIDDHLEQLSSGEYALEKLEEEAGFRFAEALTTDRSKYMSVEKYLALPLPRTLWQTRLLLYCELRLLELFTGDGLTCDAKGNRNVPEYIVLNVALEELRHVRVINLGPYVVIPADVDVSPA